MTAPRTLETALAYLLITDSKRSLHINTRVALGYYSRFETVGRRCYTVTDEGKALAYKSPLWKAHEVLTAAGFKLDTTRTRHKPGFIPYIHPEQVLTPSGAWIWRSAFTGRHGRAYMEMPSNEAKSGWAMKLVNPEA